MHWYALRVRSRHEKKVARALEGAGFEVFLPIVASLRQWSDRVKQVDEPLFPGYLFVHSTLDSETKLNLVRTSTSIVEIVGSGRRPTPIPEVEIESIRTVLASAQSITPLDRLIEGTRVRVVGGPLHGVEGIVVSKGTAGSIICSVGLLGRSVRAHFEQGHLMPIK